MLDYQKIFERFVGNYPHEIGKIEEIITMARKAGQDNVTFTFEDIIKNKQWDADEKVELLRFLGYSKRNHAMRYVDKTNSERRVGAYYYTLVNRDFVSFEALMKTFGDVERHHVEGYGSISETKRLRDIIFDIKACCKSDEISKYLKAVLDNITPEATRNILAPYYEGYSFTSVRNRSSMAIIIASQDLELIQRCLAYVDDVNIYLNDAVATGNIEIVNYFLDLGADINYEPEEVVLGVLSPLKTAIVHNNPEMVKFLVEHGADVNREDKNSDFIERLNDFQVVINGRINDCKPASEKDTGVKLNQLAKEASPMEIATKLIPGKYVLFPGFYMTHSQDVCFIGQDGDIKNVLEDNEAKLARNEIVEYLYNQVSDVNNLDFTDLIAFTFITKNVSDLKKYTKYAKDNNLPLDLDRLFELFFVFYGECEKTFVTPFLDFIASLDQDKSLYLKCFEYYQKKNRAISPVAFYVNDFNKALLSKIPEEKRKEICLMPYCKNLQSVKELLALGFDLQQTDADGRNILFFFFLNGKKRVRLSNDEEALFAYLLENVDLAVEDSAGKTALYYAMLTFPTEEEALYARADRVCTLSGQEKAVAALISKMSPETISHDDINFVLEKRAESLSGYGDTINYTYVYQHHAQLFLALIEKGFILNRNVLGKIFSKLYPKDPVYVEALSKQIDVGATLDFVYEKLDLNTDIQNLDIKKEYNNLVARLKEMDLSLDEFLNLFAVFYSMVLSLKAFYENSVQKKFSPEKYLEYVAQKYNTQYAGLDAYVLLIILQAIRKFGSVSIDAILAACPGFDLNTYLEDADVGLNYWAYIAQVSEISFDEDGEPVYGDEHFDAQNVIQGWDDDIVFTGGLMQYAILTDDLPLVQNLLQRDVSMQLVIDDDDHTWDYVNSKTMLQYMEAVLGKREYSDLGPEERAFYLSLLEQDNEAPENPSGTLKR